MGMYIQPLEGDVCCMEKHRCLKMLAMYICWGSQCILMHFVSPETIVWLWLWGVRR